MSEFDIPAERLVIITPTIEIWSGTVQIHRETDLHEIEGGLPPRGLVSDGRKQLISTKPLRALHAVRKKFERAVKAKGFTGLIASGVAVGESFAEDFLGKEYVELETDFNDAVEKLVADLPQHYADQVEKYPEWKSMLEDAQLSPDTVRKRCKFGAAVFRIAAPEGAEDSAVASLYGEMTSKALPKLCEDIAKDAEKLIDRFQGKAWVKQASLDAVKALVAKLGSFGFLDARVNPSTSSMETMLATLPTTGSLDAQQGSTCLSVLYQLADPAKIVSHGEAAAMDGESRPSDDDDQPEPTEVPCAPDDEPVAETTPAAAQPLKKSGGFAISM